MTTEYPYDENPDPNAPNQRAQTLTEPLQAALDAAIACARGGDADATLRAIQHANMVLWQHKDALAAQLNDQEIDGPTF